MLINKNTNSFDPDNIVVLKMHSGEEVMGRVKEKDDTHVHLYRPCSLGMGPGGPALNKWLVFGDKDCAVPVRLSEIAAGPVKPDREIAEHYESITSNIVKASGLVT